MSKRRSDGKLMLVTAELVASLAPLAKLCGGADPAKVAAAAAALSKPRQEQLPHSGTEVEDYLRGLGIEEPQLRACWSAAHCCSASQRRSERGCCLGS